MNVAHYGRLTVLRTERRGGYEFAECVCECGKAKTVRVNHLRSGATRSCGCIQKERTIQASTKHGFSKSPEYKIWRGMMNRCCNPHQEAYEKYGARGITVCDRWRQSFQAFFTDMGPRPSADHSIDRFPLNGGNYEPGNCRWATAKEQARNTRANRLVTFDNETLTLAELSERFGIDQTIVSVRLRCGWTLRDAVSLPVTARKPARADGLTANQVYTEQELQDDYKRVYGLLHRAPSMSEYKRHGTFSYMTLWRRFGSWPTLQMKWHP